MKATLILFNKLDLEKEKLMKNKKEDIIKDYMGLANRLKKYEVKTFLNKPIAPSKPKSLKDTILDSKIIKFFKSSIEFITFIYTHKWIYPIISKLINFPIKSFILFRILSVIFTGFGVSTLYYFGLDEAPTILSKIIFLFTSKIKDFISTIKSIFSAEDVEILKTNRMQNDESEYDYLFRDNELPKEESRIKNYIFMLFLTFIFGFLMFDHISASNSDRISYFKMFGDKAREFIGAIFPYFFGHTPDEDPKSDDPKPLDKGKGRSFETNDNSTASSSGISRSDSTDSNSTVTPKSWKDNLRGFLLTPEEIERNRLELKILQKDGKNGEKFMVNLSRKMILIL